MKMCIKVCFMLVTVEVMLWYVSTGLANSKGMCKFEEIISLYMRYACTLSSFPYSSDSLFYKLATAKYDNCL